jgi:hypothetical protein
MIDVIDNVGTPILPEPSYEEASERKIVEHNGVKYLATYYPSMGGYAGKCLVRLSAELNGCIDC